MMGFCFQKYVMIFKDILWKFNLIGSNVIFLFKAFFFFFIVDHFQVFLICFSIVYFFGVVGGLAMKPVESSSPNWG